MDKKTVRSILLIITYAVLLFCAVWRIDAVASFVLWVLKLVVPITLGLVIAFVINIPLSALERIYPDSPRKWVRRAERPVCILLAFVVIIAIITLVCIMVIPQLWEAGRVLSSLIPGFVESVQNWLVDVLAGFPELREKVMTFQFDWQKLSGTILQISSGMLGIVGSTFTVIFTTIQGVVNFLIAIFFSLYLLMQKETLLAQVRAVMEAYVPKKVREPIFRVANVSNTVFRNFITGQCMEAVIIGSLCALGMAIFRFPYPAAIGSLVGITALIPVVGAFLGTAVGMFLIVMINPIQALLFLVFILVLQQVEGNFIYPRVVGSSVGLPPLWVLAAITIGAGIGGILGMLLAVPIASTVYFLVRDDVKMREKLI